MLPVEAAYTSHQALSHALVLKQKLHHKTTGVGWRVCFSLSGVFLNFKIIIPYVSTALKTQLKHLQTSLTWFQA